jgi:DNA repair protein RecO (recombination protein O)
VIEKTRGIFLHAVKYSETSLIAHIYTEAFGRQTFIINGIRSKNSAIKASVFQPLYILDLEAYFSPGNEIHRIKNARIAVPFTSIPFDIRKSTQVLFLAEILYKCLKEEESNVPLFEFLSQSLTFFDLSQSDISNFHLWFLFKLTQFLGIAPGTDNAQISSFFDLENGTFVSHEPSHNHFANKQVSSLLIRLFEIDLATLGELKYTRDERRLVLEKMLEFYKINFGNMGEIRSIEVLKEIGK